MENNVVFLRFFCMQEMRQSLFKETTSENEQLLDKQKHGALPSLQEGSFKIRLTVPLNNYKVYKALLCNTDLSLYLLNELVYICLMSWYIFA